MLTRPVQGEPHVRNLGADGQPESFGIGCDRSAACLSRLRQLVQAAKKVKLPAQAETGG